MSVAERRRLPELIAAALALQLVVAAGALAGPWALTEPRAAAAVVAPVEAAPPPAPTGPVRLAAQGLWAGTVTAVPLAVDRRGALEVPRKAEQIGWWAAGPRPGDIGAAVVVGHVDLDGRPGVFARLATARPGAVVAVGAIRFRVTDVRRYPKKAFPTDLVYRPTERAELRLITCGGRFDRRTGHYDDNVVVTAVRV